MQNKNTKKRGKINNKKEKSDLLLDLVQQPLSRAALIVGSQQLSHHDLQALADGQGLGLGGQHQGHKGLAIRTDSA